MSAGATAPSDEIATLRIDLLDTDPPIWREVEVPISMTLKQLHAVIQAAMEWRTATSGSSPSRGRVAPSMPLQALLGPRKTKLLYTYDFGDSWEHQLTLTRPRAADPGLAYPRYLAGAGAARREIAAGFPASTLNWRPSPIRAIRITTRPRMVRRL